MRSFPLLLSCLLMLGTTSCLAQIFASEGFEDTSLPPDWVENAGSIYTDTGFPCSGTRDLITNLYDGDDVSELLSPVFNGSNGTDATVSFNMKIVDYDTNDPVTGDFGAVTVSYAVDGSSTFTTALMLNSTTYTPSASCVTQSFVVPAAAVTSSLQVRFTGLWNEGDWDFHLDEFSILQVGGCNPATGIAVTNQTLTEAEVNYTDNSGGTSAFEAEYGLSGFTLGSGTTLALAAGTTTVTLTGLSAGTEYDVYLTADCGGGVLSSTMGPITFSTLFNPPSNDECANPTSVAVAAAGATCSAVPVTIGGATLSSQAPPTCFSPFGDPINGDVWYSFTAPASGMLTVAMSSHLNGGRGVLTVYETCGGTELFCDDTYSPGNTTDPIGGLTAGTTYLLRLGSVDLPMSGLTLCLTEAVPPVNDECAGAIAIPLSSMCTVQADFTAANGPIPANSCSGGSIAKRSVWYSFVAPASGGIYLSADITFSLSVGFFQLCGGAELQCSGVSTTPQPFTGFTPGETYRFQLVRFANQTTTPTLCLSEFIPSTNDECNVAEAIGVGTAASPTAFTVDFTAASNSSPTGSCSGVSSQVDVWFSFVVPPSGAIKLKPTTTNNSPNVALFTDCGLGTQRFCGGMPDSLVVLNLTPGATMYWRFARVGGQSMQAPLEQWEYIAPPPPANDECAGAIALTDGNGFVLPASGLSYDLDGATNAGTPSSCSGSSANSADDLWYSFTIVGGDPSRTLTVSPNAQMNSTLIYYTGSCGALVPVNCSNSSNSNGGTDTQSFFASTTSTYYVRIVDTQPDQPRSNPFVISLSGSALPVELTAFAAVAKTDHTLISWTTASERNLSYFQLERSVDGDTWSIAAEIAPEGNGTQESTYSINDASYLSTVYYRLRSVDLDGTAELSAVIAIVPKAAGRSLDLTLTPTITAGPTTLHFASPLSSWGVVLVLDVRGQVVHRVRVPAEHASVELSLAPLPAGLYSVAVEAGNGRGVTRVLVE